MSKDDKPARPPRPPLPPIPNRGYQPVSVKKGDRPRPQGGRQPAAGQDAFGKPAADPPNQGSSGKK